MKKIFFGLAAGLALMGATSCGNGESGNGDNRVFSATATDSLNMSFAEFAGYTFAGQIDAAMKQDSTITKDAFLKGLQYAMAADTAAAYQYGVNIGLQMAGQFAQYEKMGVKLDKAKWLEAFNKAFMVDSVPTQLEMMQYQQDFQMWNDSLRNAKHRADVEAAENSPQAQENLQQSVKYLNQVKADAAVKETPSGLVYKIDNAGEGEKIQPKDRVVLKCNVKALNGQNPPSIPSNPMPVSQFTKGLQEGLAMLGKGGKATFYVPAKLAYDAQMAQRMGLEPNTVFIYEVEVMDIPAAPGAQSPAPGIVPVEKK